MGNTGIRIFSKAEKKKIIDYLKEPYEDFEEIIQTLENKIRFKIKSTMKDIFQKSPYNIGLCDLDGKLLYFNESGNCFISIHSIQDILGRSYKDICSLNKQNQQFIPKYEDIIEHIKQYEKPLELEFPIYKIKGDLAWVRIYTSILKLNGKKFIQFILQDITERKIAQKKIKESEEKYREIFEGSRDGFVMVDIDGKIIDANKAYCKMLGYTLKELKEFKNFYEITPRKYWDWEEKEIWNNRLLKKGYSGVYEKEYIRKDGSIFPVELQSYAVFNDNKNPIYLWGIARDISKKNEAKEKLIASEKKYRELTDLLPDIIYEADKKCNVTFTNTKGFKEFGYTKEDLQKGINVMDIIADEHKSKAKANIKRLLKGEETEASEYLLVRKNGTTFFARIHSRPLYREGKIIGFVGTISNIHKRVMAKKKIKESQRELQQLNKLKSELLRRTSHELKTPLVSIKGFLHLLMQFHINELSEDAIKFVNEIEYGCERLEQLIKDILDAAKLESGKIEFLKSKENLSELIEISVKSLKSAADLKNQTINLDIHENMTLEIEKEKILQVLDNIILNAIKNTPEGGSIKLTSIDSPKEYLIAIQDDGIGFTEREKKILFTQFGKIIRKEGNSHLNNEGTGLGLYISKKIIELHDGKIWAKSEGKSRGSTFYISLPKTS